MLEGIQESEKRMAERLAGGNCATPKMSLESLDYAQAAEPRTNPRYMLERKISQAREYATHSTAMAAEQLKKADELEALGKELPPVMSPGADRALSWLLSKI